MAPTRTASWFGGTLTSGLAQWAERSLVHGLCDGGVRACGERIKILPIVDAFTREPLGIVADSDISGHYVARVSTRAERFRGFPRAILTNRGPEFTGEALNQRACDHSVDLKLVEAGKLIQSAYIESFNERFGDVYLNGHWFMSLDHLRAVIAERRRDTNERRRHSASGYLAAAEFTARRSDQSIHDNFGNEGC